jgi:protein SCO1
LLKVSLLMSYYMRLLLLSLLLLSLGGCGGAPELKGTALDPALPAYDFTLTDQYGQPFTLSEQQGKLVLIFFGFASCPDICPIELANLAAVRRELGSAAETVQVVMVTLDPERDTPERLARYVSAFDPTFVGLHGDAESLAPIIKAYGVYSERRDLPDSALGYTIDHSGFVYLIDKAGRWRTLYAHGTAVADIASDVRVLARER